MRTSLKTRWTAFALALGAAFTIAPLLPATAAPESHDGSSSERAAASCYEAKLLNPAARSGTYWLYTPEMSGPERFYCDQETDGGGWVMVGRGREEWTESYNGKGDPAELYTNPQSVSAFKPVQLSSTTINALMNGAKLKDQQDGIRFRRAYNTQGTSWQEVRAHREQAKQWTWAMSWPERWGTFSFVDPGGRQNTRLAKTSRMYDVEGKQSLRMYANPNDEYKIGFAYGYDMQYGIDSPQSYIYHKAETTGFSVPFTQIYLRPRLTQKDLRFSSLGANGSAASHRRALPESYTMPVKWRTSEETYTGRYTELNTQVQSFAQVGNTVFTGGDFAYVESAAGARVDQANIAGYNVDSGELVTTFRPTVNGQVKSMVALPGNRLAIGGEFTRVNGVAVNHFAILDATSGSIDKSWDIQLERRGTTAPVQVKSMQVQGDYLYIAGNFTHVKGHTSPNAAYSRGAARIKLSTGEVDRSWRPIFNGTVNSISASADNSVVHAAGYFSQLNSKSAFRLAAMNGTNASNIPWSWELSYTPKDKSIMYGYQFAVQDTGDKVFTGGTEHLIASYRKSDHARTSQAISREGGDFQSLSLSGSNVYGSCHCGHVLYSGTGESQQPWDSSYHDVHSIRLIAAFDKDSGEMIGEFNPVLKGKHRVNAPHDFGVWASFTDSRGNLWAGGDIIRSLGAYGEQSTVGFARFAPRDVTPPATPSSASLARTGDKDRISWKAVPGAQYQVMRDDRVIATVTGTDYTVAHRDGARYAVRTIDSAGNYSVSTVPMSS
ncbi:MAG: fibrinogen-like YCDxxxxGGGW domain-containing protein [Rothia sp. (in: high G+C Gram-positive bacteria)]|uniref:fibrinogen-like YCDxxxxGGGW domain-containing protein n=1 Tax=Rothia sp. (in: high G+C Gram-positive bacteria) TaxID=1885016 RepID=UPI0026DF61F3|nr:fibrinogen-like YCDxxxxGGGW domain-containing protein [Rothia sp. (in: high G+C Gram-positive bacteria)]MDO5750325.1 fibrinogen-like YCDxxxxGGGW domain-containing protein [Rothia sp. (in: high G+C Gram-positive bacteria)]